MLSHQKPNGFLYIFGWVFIAASIVGCGGRAPERAIVSGKIAYNGIAIQHGIIRFVPDTGVDGPTVAAVISDGNYRVDARGGVPLGKHTVQIEAYRFLSVSATSTPFVPGLPNANTEGVREQYLPERFNKATTLEISIESDGTDVIKDFDLTN